MNNEIKKIYSFFSFLVFGSCLLIAANHDFLTEKKVQKTLPVKAVEQASDNGGKLEQLPTITKKEDVSLSAEPELNEVIQSDNYIGNWKRVKMTIGGVDVPSIGSYLILREGYFKKITDCKISGDLVVNETKMAIRVTNDECNQGQQSFINDYTLSSDHNTLTLIMKDSNYEAQDIYERIIK
ncbi:MAG: hypothetical protein PHW52_00810 [Candidatus Pacebacteria bacterium]|nr:hypothetical protein [Candidatus Paceibacterota bacterium]